jgi:hypothetical protein
MESLPSNILVEFGKRSNMQRMAALYSELDSQR